MQTGKIKAQSLKKLNIINISNLTLQFAELNIFIIFTQFVILQYNCIISMYFLYCLLYTIITIQI